MTNKDQLKDKDYATYVRENLKPESRHMPIILPGTAVAIVDKVKGQILLQRRTDNDTIGMLGGGINITEEFEDCAVREIYEESGLLVDPSDVKHFKTFKGPKFVTTHPNGDVVVHINWAAIVDFKSCNGKMITKNSKTKELIWVKFEDVLNLDLFKANRPMLEEIIIELTK